MTPAEAAFWDHQCTATGYDGPPFDIAMFGTPDMADELLALILAGRKRATAMLHRWVETGEASLPVPGKRSLVLDALHQPRAVIETLRVRIAPMRAVTAHHAFAEGEGNRTVSDWLRVHRAFFRAEARRYGFAFHERLPVVFEEFRLIRPPARRS